MIILIIYRREYDKTGILTISDKGFKGKELMGQVLRFKKL